MAGAITMAIVEEFGPEEVLDRLSDPWWFQAFGCVLGFDWHSSGVTTVTCGAMKEAYKECGKDLGIIVTGGKGGTSRKTPAEIETASSAFGIDSGEKLVYASKMSAKVDSAAVQDGFNLYQHNMFFTPNGKWCVIQQGMNGESQWARRYHWLGKNVDDFVCEPHHAIENLSQKTIPEKRDSQILLNMVAREAEKNRSSSAELVCEHPDEILEEIKLCTQGPTLFAPAHHRVLSKDVNLPRIKKLILETHEKQPENFETLLGLPGVGPAAIRSLSLIAEIIYQAPPSYRDPAEQDDTKEKCVEEQRKWADYSYAHGGKDGTPFPVDRELYDRNISVLSDAIKKARLGSNEKMNALKKLSHKKI